MEAESIKKIALANGVSLCGIARVRELSEQVPRFERWVDSGYYASLEYMRKYSDVRFNPSELLDGGRSVIVCAFNYKSIFWDDAKCHDPERPKIASYALAEDYHNSIRRVLKKIVGELRGRYGELSARICVDTAPILEKAWAVEAGLGWIGKNSLLVTPRYGSYVLLGEIVMDREVDTYDVPFDGDLCGDCDMCVRSCPNGAIVAPRVIDANRCVARLTVESTEGMPATDRDALHGWVHGCDLCIAHCPRNQKTELAASEMFRPLLDPVKMGKSFWKNLTEQQFATLCGKTPLKRTGLENIKTRLSHNAEPSFEPDAQCDIQCPD